MMCANCEHRTATFMNRRCLLTGNAIPLFSIPVDCPRVVISNTETTSCEWCKSFDRFEFNPIDHDGNCIPDEYCMVQSGLAAYCPNCGRKIKED